MPRNSKGQFTHTSWWFRDAWAGHSPAEFVGTLAVIAAGSWAAIAVIFKIIG